MLFNLRARGYRTVALSSSADKVDLAKRLGATSYIDGSKEDIAEALKKLGGAKVIVYTSQSSKMLDSMIGGLAIDGQLLVLGFPDATPLYLRKHIILVWILVWWLTNDLSRSIPHRKTRIHSWLALWYPEGY